MKAAVVTVSDSCFEGRKDDATGPALRDALAAAGWNVQPVKIVPDDPKLIRQMVLRLAADPDLRLLATAGGTGVSPRDQTPEAVRPLLDKEIPGLAELMRLRGLEKTDFAALSRSLAGARGELLVLCLPGSPKGAVESLQAVIGLLPHAVDLLQGKTRH